MAAMCPEYKQILIDAAHAQARFLDERAAALGRQNKHGAALASATLGNEACNLRDAIKALEAV